MANSNNWGEIYNSTWWGDEDWSANSLKIDSAPPGFAGQNLLLGSEELQQSNEGKWERLNINAVDANVAGVANPLSSDETVEKIDFQATSTSRILQDVTLVAGTQYTFSVWAKSASASNEQFRLRYWDRTAASGGGDLFTALTTDWSPTSGRYSFTFTAASSGVHAMHIQNSGSVQRSIYFWGAMLNEGATAGDYIKTEFPFGLSNPPTPPMEFGDNFAGVTAYYSLRRFTTGEDNNAIRVRKEVSLVDEEQDIGFDANGDLDTSALLEFATDADGGNVYVSIWYDQSGNGNNATNATESEQPLVVSGGTLVEENGKAAIDFDGVDDYFTLNAPITVPQSDFFITDVVSNVSTGFTAPYGSNNSDEGLAYPRTRARLEGKRLTTNTSVTDWCGAQGIYTIEAISNLYTPYENGTARGTALSVSNAYTIRSMMVRRASDLLGITGGKLQERIIFLSDQSGNRGSVALGTGIEGNINEYFDIV